MAHVGAQLCVVHEEQLREVVRQRLRHLGVARRELRDKGEQLLELLLLVLGEAHRVRLRIAGALDGADIDVEVDLGAGGPGVATVRTTDLSHAYVEINSAYST